MNRSFKINFQILAFWLFAICPVGRSAEAANFAMRCWNAVVNLLTPEIGLLADKYQIKYPWQGSKKEEKGDVFLGEISGRRYFYRPIVGYGNEDQKITTYFSDRPNKSPVSGIFLENSPEFTGHLLFQEFYDFKSPLGSHTSAKNVLFITHVVGVPGMKGVGGELIRFLASLSPHRPLIGLFAETNLQEFVRAQSQKNLEFNNVPTVRAFRESNRKFEVFPMTKSHPPGIWVEPARADLKEDLTIRDFLQSGLYQAPKSPN